MLAYIVSSVVDRGLRSIAREHLLQCIREAKRRQGKKSQLINSDTNAKASLIMLL